MTTPHAERPAMADYGVDEPGWEPLPWSWAAERLLASRNFWLVTVAASGRPHALPVWAVWSETDHRFGFSCATGARKARNLAANPWAVVTVEDTVECVSVEGQAAQVTDPARLEEWVQCYLEKYLSFASDLTGDFLRANLFFEFRPERAFGIIERAEEFATRATRWRFDTA